VFYKLCFDFLRLHSGYCYSSVSCLYAYDPWLEDGGGGYDLAITGDSVFLYCRLSNDTFNTLAGLSFSFDGRWADPGLTVDEYSTHNTSQPDELKQVGSIVLTKYSIWDFVGDGLENYTGTQKKELQQNMINADNWKGSGYKSTRGVGITREWCLTATLDRRSVDHGGLSIQGGSTTGRKRFRT
jgi:hypothetical protein